MRVHTHTNDSSPPIADISWQRQTLNMRWMLLLLLPFAASSCDQFSQRIWNCSGQPLSVTTVLDTGGRVNDVIPAGSYIGSMKGGVQIVALQKNGRVIWERPEA